MTERALRDALTAYLRDLKAKRSDNTVKTYSGRLRHFAGYVSLDTPLSELTPSLLAGFPSWLVKQEMAKASRDMCLIAVWGFIAFLFRNDYVTMDAASYERVRYEFSETRRKRADARSLPEIPSRQAVEAAIEAARSVPKPDPQSRDARRYELQRLRDVALLELLRATGLRVGEVVALTRGSLDHEHRKVRVTVTKSRDARLVPVDDAAWDAVQAYLQARDGRAGARTLPLFSGHARKSGDTVQPVTTRTVQVRVKALARLAGVEERLTPHSFRHRLATDLVRITNLEVARKTMGHQDIKTTQRYTHLVEEDVEQAMQQLREANGNGGEG